MGTDPRGVDVQCPFAQEPGTQGRPWLGEGLWVVSKKQEREPQESDNVLETRNNQT